MSEDTAPNRRNGKGRKTVKTELGQVDIDTPRDRAGRFSPQLVPKRSRTLGRGLERQIIALYARGNSYADIRDYLADMYGVEASTATISRITEDTALAARMA